MDTLIRAIEPQEMAKYYQQNEREVMEMEKKLRNHQESIREKQVTALLDKDSLRKKIEESLGKVKLPDFDSLKELRIPETQHLEDLHIKLNIKILKNKLSI